jgi:hypothetical protein
MLHETGFSMDCKKPGARNPRQPAISVSTSMASSRITGAESEAHKRRNGTNNSTCPRSGTEELLNLICHRHYRNDSHLVFNEKFEGYTPLVSISVPHSFDFTRFLDKADLTHVLTCPLRKSY